MLVGAMLAMVQAGVITINSKAEGPESEVK